MAVDVLTETVINRPRTGPVFGTGALCEQVLGIHKGYECDLFLEMEWC